jgi:hypothetical protein
LVNICQRLTTLEQVLNPSPDPELEGAKERLFLNLEQIAARAGGEPKDPAHASPMELIAVGQYDDALTVQEERGFAEEQLRSSYRLIVEWEARRTGQTLEEVCNAIEREIENREALGEQS